MKCARPNRAQPVRSSSSLRRVLGGCLYACNWFGTVACQAGSSMGGGSLLEGPEYADFDAESGLAGPSVDSPRNASEVSTRERAIDAERLGTAAPQPARATDPALEALLTSCGAGDRTLHRAASKLLSPELLRHPLDHSSLTFAIRTSGGPYVKPRGLRLHRSGSADPSAFDAPLREWLSTLAASPDRRCGIASSTQSESGYWLSVVAAEALADLEPLPTRVDRGERIHFLAHLLMPGTQASLVVLGPQGAPRELEALLLGDRVEASFFLDSPGLHQIQLMVDDAGGPAAAVEAWVGVGQALPSTLDASSAPGEQVHVDPSAPERALLDMLNAARASERLPPLEADPLLAQLAREHARAMRRSQRLEHDLGDGSPRWRLEAGGVHAATAGENLARAPTLTRAHRAIWTSPSHRANLLNPHFDGVGIGVARSTSGEWWVCELLADLR